MKNVLLSVASVCFIALAGASSAATIDFDSGSTAGGVYTEGNFMFEYTSNGSVSTPANCVDDGIQSSCLLTPNKKIVKMSHVNGDLFSLLSFSFDGKDGQGSAVYASLTDGDPSLPGSGAVEFFEDQNASDMTGTGTLTLFKDVAAVYFSTGSNGSGRIDNINVSVASVPLPATGLMMLAGLGAFGAMKRRKT